MNDVILQADDISHRYRPGEPVLDRIDLDVRRGEFLCVVGPSGCGKSTLLRILGGLLSASQGTTTWHGQRVEDVPPGLAFVFQSYERSLMPWLRVDGNVEFPLRGRLGRRERARRRFDALAAVGLTGHGHKYPWELSGGMQQRVAIARALAVEPEVLLLDEPLASVDALTRAGLEDLLLALHAQHGVTIVLVTHDIDASIYLADRVAVMSPAPSRVIELIDVALPRPRHQLDTREHPEFLTLRHMVMKRLWSSSDHPALDGSAGSTCCGECAGRAGTGAANMER